MSEAPTSAPSEAPGADITPTPAADAPAASAEATAAPPEGAAAAAATGDVTPPAGADSEAGTIAAGADTSPPESGPPATIDPASYTFTLPEAIAADEGLTTKARETLAAAGVAPEAAQPLVDLFAEALTIQQSTQVAAFTAQQSEWLTEINALPEFTGPTREKSIASLGRVMDEYGSPEAKEALNSYGVGNNPALVKMMLKMAQALDEGTPAPASRPAPNGKGGARAQGSFLSYPNTPEIPQG